MWDAAPIARKIFLDSGSCGLSTYQVGNIPDYMPLVAMPISVMRAFGDSQDNLLCGSVVTMTNPKGVTQQAIVADTNMSETDNSVDMTMDLWVGFGQPSTDASVIRTLTWSLKYQPWSKAVWGL
ncbi:hypothetical protein BGZ63DRAFT_392159, partial [Mariannaea sp. PMI_226]